MIDNKCVYTSDQKIHVVLDCGNIYKKNTDSDISYSSYYMYVNDVPKIIKMKCSTTEPRTFSLNVINDDQHWCRIPEVGIKKCLDKYGPANAVKGFLQILEYNNYL